MSNIYTLVDPHTVLQSQPQTIPLSWVISTFSFFLFETHVGHEFQKGSGSCTEYVQTIEISRKYRQEIYQDPVIIISSFYLKLYLVGQYMYDFLLVICISSHSSLGELMILLYSLIKGKRFLLGESYFSSQINKIHNIIATNFLTSSSSSSS